MEYKILGTDIKKIQNEQFKILCEIDSVCKKHGIKYQLMAGTLLGAIRHNGFIPWDDDIDICMLRKEYEYFLKICKANISSEYFLQTIETDKEYIMYYAKIRKNNTLFIEKSSSDADIHHGIYIDIFPLDDVLPNSFIGSIQQKLLYVLGRINLTRSKSICNDIDNNISKSIALIVHYFLKYIPKKWCTHIFEEIAKIFNKRNTIYVTHLTNGASKKRYYKYMIKKSDFYDQIEGEFEGKQFPIPQNYNEILINLFGDYMKLPPRKDRFPHHGVIKVII